MSSLNMRPTRSVSAFLKRCVLRNYGVLGTQLTLDGAIVTNAQPPSSLEVFVDPAGLNYIQGAPSGAGGAAGAIYKHIGIASEASFPPPVREAVTAAGDAKLHCYQAGRHCVIHAVGPDLRVGDPSWAAACDVLGRAYHKVF